MLEIDGVPVLALRSHSKKGAMDITREVWFRDELASYRTKGQPLCPKRSVFKVRNACSREAEELRISAASEKAGGEFDGWVFAFLLPIDVLSG